MATVRTAQYFIDKFVSGYAVHAVDMQDLIASIPSIGATDLTAVNEAIAALQGGAPNVITQNGAVTIPDFTSDQKLLDVCEKIDIVFGDEETDTINYPTSFFPASSNGNTFDENKLNIITEQWIKSLGKVRFTIDKQSLSTPPADTTAPTFVVESVSGLTSTSGTANFELNEAGFVNYMLTTTSTKPSKADILAGTGQVGSNHGSKTMLANVANTAAISGLSASTPYYLHYYSIDSAGNENSTVSTLSFSTTSTADTTAPTMTFAIAVGTPNIIDITPSEAVTVNSVGWSVSATGGAVTISSVTGASGTTPKFVLSRNIAFGEVVTISYDPSTGNTTDQASTPNELATISGASVTNGSTIVAEDDFNASNTSDIAGRATIGGYTWAKIAGTDKIGIVSNQAAFVSNGGDGDVWYMLDVKRYARVDFVIGALDYPGYLAFYVGYADQNNFVRINTFSGGVDQKLASNLTTPYAGVGAFAANDIIGVDYKSNNTIDLYKNNVLVQSSIAISSSITGTKIGFEIYTNVSGTLNKITIK